MYWPGNPPVPDIKDPAHGRGEVDYVPPVIRPYDGDEDEEPEKDQFVFTIFPNPVERDVPFTMEIRIFDSNGVPQTYNTNATLQFISSDGNDTFNFTNITLNGGVFYTNIAEITGGAGIQAGSLQVVGAPTIKSATVTFQIVEQLIQTMQWTVPSLVNRGEDFTVILINGPINQAIDVDFFRNDIGDRVYKRSTGQEITSITLDGAGGYTANDWYIQGGSGLGDFGFFIAIDPNQIYADAPSNQFTINGISDQFAKDVIRFSDTQYQSNYELVLGGPANISGGIPFQLTVTMLFAGSTATGFDGPATLKLWSKTDETYIPWVEGGPNGTVSGDELIVDLVEGQWSFNDCEIDLTGISNGELELQGECYLPAELNFARDSIPINYDVPRFVVILPPTVTRGVNETLQVIAVDSLDQPLTTYNNISELTIDLVSQGGGVIVTPNTIPIGSFIDGGYSVQVQFTGGTGYDGLIVSITDPDFGLTGAAETTLDPVTVFYGGSYAGVVGIAYEDYGPNGDNTIFEGLQAQARADYPYAVLGQSFPYGIDFAGWRAGHSNLSGYYNAGGGTTRTRYTITQDFKDNAQSAYWRIRHEVESTGSPLLRWHYGGTLYWMLADADAKLDTGSEIQGLNGDAVMSTSINAMNAAAAAAGATSPFITYHQIPSVVFNWMKSLAVGQEFWLALYAGGVPIQPLYGGGSQVTEMNFQTPWLYYNK
jgi:hypothetical protein